MYQIVWEKGEEKLHVNARSEAEKKIYVEALTEAGITGTVYHSQYVCRVRFIDENIKIPVGHSYNYKSEEKHEIGENTTVPGYINWGTSYQKRVRKPVVVLECIPVSKYDGDYPLDEMKLMD